MEIATLGGGCFWCLEAFYQDINGIFNIKSGYMGGHTLHPNYEEVCSGKSGHAEVVQFEYDLSVISYDAILEIFWHMHNPTTLNRQGNDVGTQYRSVIFYHNEAQKSIAEQHKRILAPQFWEDPIVTEIAPASTFYMAEDYHQRFYHENPNHGYCQVMIRPKLSKLKKAFSQKMKQ